HAGFREGAGPPRARGQGRAPPPAGRADRVAIATPCAANVGADLQVGPFSCTRYTAPSGATVYGGGTDEGVIQNGSVGSSPWRRLARFRHTRKSCAGRTRSTGRHRPRA